MRNIAILLAAAVATVTLYALHYYPFAWVAGAVFAVVFVIEMKANRKAEGQWQEKIVETHEALKTGLLDTHLLVVQKLAGYPDVAKKAIGKLIEAAGYLGGPPSSRMVIDASYVVEWNKQGLALVAEAKAIVDELVTARPFAGGLGDTIR
jgi:hypothetical protein